MDELEARSRGVRVAPGQDPASDGELVVRPPTTADIHMARFARSIRGNPREIVWMATRMSKSCTSLAAILKLQLDWEQLRDGPNPPNKKLCEMIDGILRNREAELRTATLKPW